MPWDRDSTQSQDFEAWTLAFLSIVGPLALLCGLALQLGLIGA